MNTIKKLIFVAVSLIVFLLPVQLQAQRKMEKLGRGTVAIRKSASSVFVSWRILGTEFSNGTTYNLYHDNTLIASDLAVSNYTDSNSGGGKYAVAPVINGVEQEKSPEVGIHGNQVFEVPIEYLGDYFVHLAWVGDLDGDGEYEFVVDRIPNIADATCKVEAYEKDGTRLWQVNMGPLSLNRDGIEGGAAVISNGMWDGVTVYDLDMDGKAEVVIKSANGTIFGDGTTLNYSNDIQNFLSVVDGLTGAEISRVALPADYMSDGPLQTQLNIAYLDGVHPSVVVKAKNRKDNGAFNLLVSAYDYNGEITQRWKWLRGSYNAPEFHQQRIVDVDLDGKDEICDGGYVLDDNGTPLYSLGYQGIVHGDRFHIGDFDPDRPGLEGYGIQQDNASGLAWYYYDASDGTLLQTQYRASIGDYARGNVADLDPNHTGFEMWTFTDGIYNVQDGRITSVITGSYPNLRLWWDGDLQSEMLDGVKFLNWNYSGNYEERILTASDWGATYTWRNVPVLYGDIMGDWREEVVYEKSDHRALQIFNTTDPTSERIYTLAHNPEYRLCMATKGYYQSAQLDYYLGYDMTTPPIPAMQRVKAVWAGLASQEWNQTDNNWDVNNVQSTYEANDSVLFGIEGTGHTNVTLNDVIEPAITYVISPVDYLFSGTGELSGNGDLIKSGYSTLTLGVKGTYTGRTSVEQGTLVVNDDLTESKVSVLGGATLAGTGTIFKPASFEKRSVIAPGMPGEAGTLSFKDDLVLTQGMICAFDLTDDSTGLVKPGDKLICDSDVVINKITFRINSLDDEIKSGVYPLIAYDGAVNGSLSDVTIEGLFGRKFVLLDTLNAVALKIFGTRDPSTIVWDGSDYSWDLQNNENWLLKGNKTQFVAGDSVVFDETGKAQTAVILNGSLPVGQLTVNGPVNYRILGSGVLGGEGDVVVNEQSTLQLYGSSNTYSGKTIINGGTLYTESFDVAGKPSAVGANSSVAPEAFVLNNAVLNYRSAKNNYTDKGMMISGQSDTIIISQGNSTLSVSGYLKGSGGLVKKGAGTLYLMDNSNSYTGGTVIEEGAIQLNDPGSGQNVRALGTGLITFKGGTLKMGNTRDYTDFNSNIFVPEGSEGTIEADMRCNYGGKLTGAGILNLILPGDIDRTIFRGDWSDFQGTVHVEGVSPLRLSGSAGYGNMTFDLASGMTMYFSTGTSSGDNTAQTVYVGGVTGPADSYLRSENWFIGANNEDCTFDGQIQGNSLTKVGSGMLILTNNNTYGGGTTVSSGTLFANNATGSATGTGTVRVNTGGTLDGVGIINGSVVVNNGGVLSPGWKYGTFTVNNNVTLNAGATLLVDVNTSGNTCDKIRTNGKTVSLGGTLQMNKLTSDDYQEGDSFELFANSNVTGAFDAIEPANPGPGLAWDTSLLNEQGIIKVMKSTSIQGVSKDQIRLFPNPVKYMLTIDIAGEVNPDLITVKSLSGKVLHNSVPSGKKELDMSALAPGIYIVEIKTADRVVTYKVCKE
ncbi:autotransporter-associated beta strand repeat-containing protein [Saccharicrinis sp. FJH54]|uniref:rhamnogalacturonan lyase family protein n=1 Tax=Saccharicrinis sp. FJH54 TaxID=3344665 RepID=UPI0035D42F37